MQIIQLSTPHSLFRENIEETYAAIGFFDGLHKGHQAVIGTAVEKAKREGKESAVISFHPHPSVVLRKPSKPVQYVTPLEEKEQLLKQMGIGRLYVINFNEELSRLSPEQFIKDYIIQLHITHLVAGFDFTFGFKGAGNMDNIHQFSQNQFTTEVVGEQTYEEEKISSTRIRAHLAAGEIEKVTPLLGRPYETIGQVVEGDKRGRKLGFPTANLAIEKEKLLPKQGVYAVKVIHDYKTYYGMANLGVKPTFVEDQTVPSVEVNIFDFDQDIYDETLTLQWYHHIRDEQKFNGIDEIVQQLQQDEKQIRQFFKID